MRQLMGSPADGAALYRSVRGIFLSPSWGGASDLLASAADVRVSPNPGVRLTRTSIVFLFSVFLLSAVFPRSPHLAPRFPRRAAALFFLSKRRDHGNRETLVLSGLGRTSEQRFAWHLEQRFVLTHWCQS